MLLSFLSRNRNVRHTLKEIQHKITISLLKRAVLFKLHSTGTWTNLSNLFCFHRFETCLLNPTFTVDIKTYPMKLKKWAIDSSIKIQYTLYDIITKKEPTVMWRLRETHNWVYIKLTFSKIFFPAHISLCLDLPLQIAPIWRLRNKEISRIHIPSSWNCKITEFKR